MRAAMMIVSVVVSISACGNSEEEGRRAAMQKAADETKAEVAAKAAVKINPPVPGRAHVPCPQLLDTAKFTEALAEVEPLTLKDETATDDADAAASCALIRGGVRPDQAQQGAIIKKNGGRLGVIPGDEVCRVLAYCWTIEDEAHLKERCARDHMMNDETMGGYACVKVVMVGADDVNSYQFFDTDTKCIFKVHGGPSMIDNNLILNCAKAARDLIGPDQIAVGGAPAAPAPAPAPAAGSGSGAM